MSKMLKTFCFKDFSKGLNSEKLRSEIEDSELYSVVNMYPKGSKLCTRSGLKKLSNYSVTDDTNGYSIKKLSETIYTNQKAIKLFLAKRESDKNFSAKLIIADSNCQINTLSLYNYTAENYENGISAVNCFCFSGKPVKANGIFIIIGIVDNQNSVFKKHIFELSESLNSLVEINDSETYAPFVLVNGKGESYAKLSTAERDFPAEQILEDFNILSSAFCSAFKTDGVSSEFYLPVKKLSAEENENIIITYTDSYGVDYLFTVPYNSDYSSAKEINGVYYRVKVTRNKGKIEIIDSDNAQKALPIALGINNNLIIKAYKKPDLNRLFKMSIAKSFNSRVFLSGNSEEGNIICFSKLNNPLYFPESNVAYFGDKASMVTAICQQNDRLIIFKPNEIGICSTVKFSEYNIDLILLGKSNRTSTLESMNIKSINSNIGCITPETLVNCANRLIFYGTDKKVYAITGSSNYLQRLYHISRKIDNLLNTTTVYNNIFAINYSGKYMLFLGNKCFLFDYESNEFFSSTASSAKQKDDIAWFYFYYDIGKAKLFSSICFNNNALLFANYSDSSGIKRIVFYSFDGKYDYKMTAETDFEQNEISCSFSTKTSDFNEDRAKQIVKTEFVFGIECNQSTNQINASYTNENLKKANFTINLNNENNDSEVLVIKSVCIFGTRYFGLNLNREGTFSIKSIKIYYK